MRNKGGVRREEGREGYVRKVGVGRGNRLGGLMSREGVVIGRR